MKESELKSRISELGDGEFWRGDTESMLLAGAADLMAHGYSDDEALEFIENMWSVVSGEYGN